MNNCIFCKIVKKEIPSKICYEDKKILAFDDINPQTPIHKIIIPNEHIASINDLISANSELIGQMVLVAKKIAKENNIAENGYRLVMNCNHDGGQEVFHLHLHLLGGRKMTWPPG